MAILITLVSCGNDEDPEIKPTPKKNYANIANAIVTNELPLQRFIKPMKKYLKNRCQRWFWQCGIGYLYRWKTL